MNSPEFLNGKHWDSKHGAMILVPFWHFKSEHNLELADPCVFEYHELF